MQQYSLEHRHYSDHFLTSASEAGEGSDVAAARVFDELYEAVVVQGVTSFQEKVFGPVEARDDVLKVRQRSLAAKGLDPDLPCSYIDGRMESALPEERMAPTRGPIAVQIWGVVPASRESEECVSVTTVELSERSRGRLLTGPGLRILWIPSVTGMGEDGQLLAGHTAQAERMFINAETALQTQGFTYLDVVRTWIYLRRILEWYGELNRIRTDFHDSRGITGRPEVAPFPASTGIQGTSAGEECVMDVLAVQGEVVAEPLIKSSRQNEPIAYGSGFSRGMSLSYDGVRMVLVSGTASVGIDGQTLHVGDGDAQALETVQSVAALLEPLGGRLRDVCAGVVYCRDEQALRSYEKVLRQMGLTDLPLIPMMADVCRSDLLIEIEAVAKCQRQEA